VLSGRTRGLIGEPELAKMKPSSYLVNTSRAPIVDPDALVHALRSRQIAGAALDVYDREPLPAGDPLRTLDNVLLTPHLGYATRENYRTFYQQAVDDIAAFLRGSQRGFSTPSRKRRLRREAQKSVSGSSAAAGAPRTAGHRHCRDGVKRARSPTTPHPR
jgi:phosphoglycerate dehydrogenase-like enzyme